MTPKEYISQGKAIIIADDFCMSNGTDSAITELILAKKLHATSILVTSDRFNDANPDLLPKCVVGLHFDLTFGKAISIEGKSIITDQSGNFNKSFAQIMLLCILKNKEMQALILVMNMAEDVGWGMHYLFRLVVIAGLLPPKFRVLLKGN